MYRVKENDVIDYGAKIGELYYRFFISDKYIINFSSPMVSELSEVISVKTYNGGDDGNDYIVKFSLRNGKKDVLVFHDMAVRDKVFKIITDAAENAADQKIW